LLKHACALAGRAWLCFAVAGQLITGDSDMSEPVVAQKAPFAVDVEAGRDYFWCACGRSSQQPFCDGAHKGSGFTPLKYHAEQTKTLYFCGCKQTATPPLCDGQHKQL